MGLFKKWFGKKEEPEVQKKEEPTVIHLPKSRPGTKYYQYLFEKDIVEELTPDKKRRLKFIASKGPIVRATNPANGLKNGRKLHKETLERANASVSEARTI